MAEHIFGGVGAACCLAAAATASAAVIAPRVTTDRSVDTHSVESIVAGVCREGMTDQEKAVALYEYTRRTMFHYVQRSERLDQAFDLDALRLINTYGYSFCTQQMLVMATLWEAAGLRCNVWSVPGHSTAQASYEGALHWFDPLIGAYVLRRDGKTIAGLQEIAADPTLLTAAAAEGRASPTFLPCGKVLYEDAARFERKNPTYVAECKALVDDLGFMAERAKAAKVFGRPRKVLYQPDLTLRAGERVVFLWENLEGEYNCVEAVPADQLPPHHFCGIEADRKDALNFPFWKPYAKVIGGVTTCRYHANGRHVYEPDLAGEALKTGVEVNTFGWHGREAVPPLRPRAKDQPANLVFKMHTPHVYTNATLTAEFHRAAEADVSRLYVSRDAGVTWTVVWEAAGAEQAAGVVKASASLKDHVRGMRDFWVRAECVTGTEPGKAGLSAFSVEAIFQHNMFARPYLVSGTNKVTVTAANPEALARERFRITYAWEENGAAKSHTQRITAAPTTYTIEVGGAELPRMRSLELAVAR